MTIRRLWVGMETHDTDESGTDDRIVLIVNDNGIDRLHHTFPDTSQDDQERGAGNVYEVNVTANNIESIRLSNSSIRVGIRGKDAWCPKHFFAWGEQSQGGTVAPIAIETDLAISLSGDENEGVLSIPIRPIQQGRSNMAIRRFLIMTTTANEAGAGTDDEVFLDIGFLGRTKSIYVSAKDFPNGAVRKKIETGKATIYLRQADILLPSAILPAKNTIDSIILRTEGDDAWLPSSFFLFGIGSFSGRPDILIPLVHIPNWNLGRLSIDEDEGRKSIPLPHALIEELDITFPGDPPGGGEIGFTLATSSGGTQISISIPKTSS